MMSMVPATRSGFLKSLSNFLDVFFLAFLVLSSFFLSLLNLPQATFSLIRFIILLVLVTIFVFFQLPLLFINHLRASIASPQDKSYISKKRKFILLKFPIFLLGAIFVFNTLAPRSPNTITIVRGEEASSSANLVYEAGELEKPRLLKNDFAKKETVEVAVGFHRMGDLKVKVFSPLGERVVLPIRIEGETLKIEPTVNLRPGKYHLKIVSSEGTVLEEGFTWGVLAINIDRSIELPGNDALLQFAVLNDTGYTICNADLDLVIKSPSGKKFEFTTKDDSIVKEEQCGPNNLIDKPDYYAHFLVPDEIGAYSMILTARTDNDEHTITDSFEVRKIVPFDVARTAPTRINPTFPYSVKLHLTSEEDWRGTVVETVPLGFEISPSASGISYDGVETVGEEKIISWNLSLYRGKEVTISYTFDAPDKSPEFYLLGPLRFTQDKLALTSFEEARMWQIAADASPKEYTSGSGQFTAEFTGDHTIILIGGGGGGAGGASSTNGRGGGGGGGGAACISVVSLTKDQTYDYSVGALGGGGAVNGNGSNGAASTFVVGGTTYSAGGGGGGQAPTVYTGGTPGTASNCDTNRTGGTGGTGTAGDSAGGGSAAGTTADGNPGTVPTGGAAVSLYGGKGGNGSIGNNVTGAPGELYGGGGGGGTGKTGSGGAGYGGYIRIEWTIPTITVSGTSNVGEGTIVRVAVNGSLAEQTGTVTSGNWQITGVTQPSADQIMTVFATDGDGDIADSSESTAISKYSGSGNMIDMVLDINTLSVGGTGAQSIAVSDLVTANYDADQDEDIMYDAEIGSLLVQAAVNTYDTEKIDILTTDTLTLSGSETLTTHHLTVTGALTSTTTSAYNVSGTWTNNGAFTQASSTVTFNGSGAQSIAGSTEGRSLLLR